MRSGSVLEKRRGRRRESSDDDDRIVSYGDATLVRSDLSILRGPHYLNDRLLHFFFCHLERNSHYLRGGGGGGAAEEEEEEDILLVPPSLAFLIANFPGGPSSSASLADVVAPLGLPRRKLVLFPVNDNPDVTLPEGGSHWSLLVCYLPSRQFVHHDSTDCNLNSPHALRLCHSLIPFFQFGSPPHPFTFIEGPTPRQTNGYDCGLFVMAIARCVCQWYRQRKRNKASESESADGPGLDNNWFGVLSEQLNATKVHQLRPELLSLVLSLMSHDSNLLLK